MELNCPFIFSGAQVYTCEPEPDWTKIAVETAALAPRAPYVRSHSPIWYSKEALEVLRDKFRFNKIGDTINIKRPARYV